jgi:hypothetical protein
MVWVFLVTKGRFCGLSFHVCVLLNMGTNGRKEFRVVLQFELLLVDELKGLDEMAITGYPCVVPILSCLGASQSRMLARQRRSSDSFESRLRLRHPRICVKLHSRMTMSDFVE